jgi:hypothetical protein
MRRILSEVLSVRLPQSLYFLLNSPKTRSCCITIVFQYGARVRHYKDPRQSRLLLDLNGKLNLRPLLTC